MAGQGAVGELEGVIAQWLRVKYAVAVSSGTLALHIALKAADVQIGDEVVVPAYDWFAATAAVLHCGAIPVFADVDERTYTIDPCSVAQRLSPKTKAIIATHLFGHPADMPKLRDLATAHGVALIEDAAQALGAVCNDKKVGAWGDLACFSFGVGKTPSCGEGGLIATNEESLYERVLALCQHPLRQRWEGLTPNPFALRAPMNPLAAAYLLEQWGELEQKLTERQSAFQRLNEVLAETRVLRPVFVREGCGHACHRFCPVATKGRWAAIVRALVAAGIPACEGLLSQPLPQWLLVTLQSGQLWWHPFPERLADSASLPCPVADRLCRTLITLDWRVGQTSDGLNTLRETLLEFARSSPNASRAKAFHVGQNRACECVEKASHPIGQGVLLTVGDFRRNKKLGARKRWEVKPAI